jgi:hypothetical protein
MLLILAHAGDDVARRLAAEWAPDAHLLSPRDLSAHGWRHFPIGGGEDTIGLAGRAIRSSEIGGVLVRIAAVSPADLPHIALDDRIYVAAEMTAFLLSFLTALPCPVVNRPSTSALMGPGWSRERWRAAAVATGIDLAVAEPTEPGELVIVVGRQCIGATHARMAERALALARAAGVDLLPLRMTFDARFVDAEPWAALPPAAAAALRALLGAPVECPP